MNPVGGRLFASLVIVAIGSSILYQACIRASTIYFFEMNTLNTIFIEKWQAAVVPIFLSLFIYLLNWSTQRALIVENKIIQQKLKLAKSASRLGSRKPSVSYSFATGQNTRRTSFSNFYQDDNMAEQARRLDRLLSSIDEHDTIQKPAEERTIGTPDSPESPKTPPPKFTVEKVSEDRVPDQVIAPRSRLGSLGHRRISERADWTDDIGKDMADDEDAEEYHDPYQRLIELDPINYCWNLFTFTPSSCTDEGLRPMDILSELVSIHLPIWGCVVAFYVILLEMMDLKLPYFFYYHGSLFAYTALLTSIACGLIHELHSNWITNNLLSLSSVYVIVSRFQVVGYQTGLIFVVGVVAADLFWYFGIDLLSTCLKNKKAPIFVMIPCDFQGKKEVFPSSTFVITGVFLGVVLKYSSMYDTLLFHNTFYVFTAALVVQILINIFRNFKMPNLILPLVTAVLASFALAGHRQDLWRFMIKH